MVEEATGDRVRRHRRFRGVTQQALAEAAGTDKAYISRLEAGGIADPGIDVLERIAAALNVSIRALADPRWYVDGVYQDPLASIEAAIISEPGLSDEKKQAGLVVLRALFASGREKTG